jgi:hypothetical protein
MVLHIIFLLIQYRQRYIASFSFLAKGGVNSTLSYHIVVAKKIKVRNPAGSAFSGEHAGHAVFSLARHVPRT